MVRLNGYRAFNNRGFPKMSYFGVKPVIWGHFRVKKRDFKSFSGQNMSFWAISGLKRSILIIFQPFSAVFGRFHVFFAKSPNFKSEQNLSNAV